MIQAFFFDLQAINAGRCARGHRAVEGHQGRRPRRRDDGRRHRLLLRPRRHGGRAQGRRRGERREGQGLLREAARQGDRARHAHRGEEGRAARPDHPDRRPGRPGRLRPGDRGGLRGPVAQAPGVRRDRAVRQPGRAAVLQHLDAADHRARRRRRPARPTSSACTSSRPVDKMPLVEIIRGEETSDEALAKAYDVVQQIRKTPIVVNDSRGFYTSRVIGTMVNEGLAMLAEGVHPMSLERAATQAGYPVGPLQLTDELNLELMAKIAQGHPATPPSATGSPTPSTPAAPSSQTMIELGRPSRLTGAGFYDYDEAGKRQGAVAGPGRGVPGRRRAAPVRRRQGPDALRRGARDREVLRGGRHRVGRRGQHRLDHGHRLPAQHRRRRAVHDRLRGPDDTDGPIGLAAFVDAGRRAGRRRTASGSAPRRTCATWRRRASPSRPDPSRSISPVGSAPRRSAAVVCGEDVPGERAASPSVEVTEPPRPVRRGRGGRRRRPGRVRRAGDRAAGAQRRRQVDHHAGAGRRGAADRGRCGRGRPRRPHRHARGQAGHRLLPRRRRPGAAGHAVGAPPARGPAAADDRLGGPRPRPARAVRARRRRRTGSPAASATAWAGGCRWCSPRSTSPTCCCSTSPSTASTRSASRRPRRDRRRPRPRRLRPGLHPPARPRHPGLRRRRSCCAAASRVADRRAPARWPGRKGRVPTALSSTDAPRASAASSPCVPAASATSATCCASGPPPVRRRRRSAGRRSSCC